MAVYANAHPIPAQQVEAGDMVRGPYGGWLTVITPDWEGGPNGRVVLHCDNGWSVVCPPDESFDTRKLLHDSQPA